MPNRRTRTNEKEEKKIQGRDLRPAAVFAASSRLFPLLLDLSTIDWSVSHLLIVHRLAQNPVNLSDPLVVSLAPRARTRAFRLTLQPIEMALRGGGELEDEDAAGVTGPVGLKMGVARDDQEVVFGFDGTARLPAEMVEI